MSSLLVIHTILLGAATSIVFAALFFWGLSKLLKVDALNCFRIEAASHKKFFIFTVAIALFELAYAALPAYRYDQWNYHLILPKILVNDGFLKPPIFNDHIFFSGYFEFFLAIPRLLLNHDVLHQSFTNAFSWIIVAALLYLAVRLWDGKQQLKIPTFFLVCYFIFAMDSHESFVNAKPDTLLFPFSLAACLLLFNLIKDQNVKKNSWLLGFVLIAPLGFKITWLQFLATFIISFSVISTLQKKSFVQGSSFLWGSIFGFVFCLPQFLKNICFFGNPIHPAQIAFFKSSYWLPEMTSYWAKVANRASNLREYFVYEGKLVQIFWIRLGFFIIPAIVAAFLLRRNPKSLKEESVELKFVFCTLIIFFLVWPLFFEPGVQTRFITPLFGISSALLLLLIKDNFSKALLASLFVPLIGGSNFEVKSKALFPHLFEKVTDHYAHFHPTQQDYVRLAPLNQHIHANFPDKKMQDIVVLSDEPTMYFADAVALAQASTDALLHWKRFEQEEHSRCIWKFLQKNKIFYFFDSLGKFEDWQPVYQEAMAASVSIDQNTKFIAPAVIASKRCD